MRPANRYFNRIRKPLNLNRRCATDDTIIAQLARRVASTCPYIPVTVYNKGMKIPRSNAI